MFQTTNGNFSFPLKEYVQATGRGGRDGKSCLCILFYRPQDRASVEDVIRLNDSKNKDKHKVSLDNVCKVGNDVLMLIAFLLLVSFIWLQPIVSILWRAESAANLCSHKGLSNSCLADRL
jgi:hypothetical protein